MAQLQFQDHLCLLSPVTEHTNVKSELPLAEGREKEGRSQVLTLGTVLFLAPRPLSLCTFICSLSGLGREPSMDQTLLGYWGDDEVLEPLSSLMSTGWREVSE